MKILDTEEVKLKYKEYLSHNGHREALFLTALHFRVSQTEIRKIVHRRRHEYPPDCIDPHKDMKGIMILRDCGY